MKKGMLLRKVVLITGASKGLGRALAVALSEDGATVAAHCHANTKEAVELRAFLRKKNRRSDIFPADLRDERATKKMVRQVVKTYGRADVLVNLVGNFQTAPIDKLAMESFRDIIETNLTAAFHCTRLVLDSMKQRRSGSIIFFGCAGADRLIVRENTGVYYLAKTGVILMAKNFAHQLAPYRIRVNTVSPGILTSSVTKLPVPMGRYATFTDIIRAVRFLLDPANAYVSGANVEVSGGWLP